MVNIMKINILKHEIEYNVTPTDHFGTNILQIEENFIFDMHKYKVTYHDHNIMHLKI